MQSDRDKEQTRTVGVGMAEDVPGVDLAQNVFNGHSGTNHVRRVVHRKNDAGHDLNVQTDAAKATESPKDVQVTRGWIVVKVAMTGRKSGLFQKRPAWMIAKTCLQSPLLARRALASTSCCGS